MTNPTGNAQLLAVIKKPHDDLGEDTFHDWITLDERVRADRNGRPNPNMSWRGNWVKWLCNNTDCTAWALVSDAAGLLAIEEAETSG